MKAVVFSEHGGTSGLRDIDAPGPSIACRSAAQAKESIEKREQFGKIVLQAP